MRKKFLMRLLTCITAFLLLTQGTITAQAQESVFSNERDPLYSASMYLGEIMELILDKYANGPVSLDELFEAAVGGMTEILDIYSRYLSKEEYEAFTDSLSGRLVGIGIIIAQNADGTLDIVRVLPSSPANDAGLKRGDRLITVNGINVDDKPVSEVVGIIQNQEISNIRITISRNGLEYIFNMVKREIPSATVFVDKFEDLLGPDYAKYSSSSRYIAIASIGETTAVDLSEAVDSVMREGVRNIILDLRGNSGGYLDEAVDICRLIVPAGPILHTIDSRGERETIRSRLPFKPFENIIVLVDGTTASAAELIAAALQDSKAATIIGETTYGKGVIQRMYPLISGGVLIVTTEEYLRRSGAKINGIGVRPDIGIFGMSPASYETKNDAALLKALELLNL